MLVVDVEKFTSPQAGNCCKFTDSNCHSFSSHPFLLKHELDAKSESKLNLLTMLIAH